MGTRRPGKTGPQSCEELAEEFRPAGSATIAFCQVCNSLSAPRQALAARLFCSQKTNDEEAFLPLLDVDEACLLQELR